MPTIPGRVHSPELGSETGWDQVPKPMIRLQTDTELTGIGETPRDFAALRETYMTLRSRNNTPIPAPTATIAATTQKTC